jgi:hypothetical protein
MQRFSKFTARHMVRFSTIVPPSNGPLGAIMVLETSTPQEREDAMRQRLYTSIDFDKKLRSDSVTLHRDPSNMEVPFNMPALHDLIPGADLTEQYERLSAAGTEFCRSAHVRHAHREDIAHQRSSMADLKRSHQLDDAGKENHSKEGTRSRKTTLRSPSDTAEDESHLVVSSACLLTEKRGNAEVVHFHSEDDWVAMEDSSQAANETKVDITLAFFPGTSEHLTDFASDAAAITTHALRPPESPQLLDQGVCNEQAASIVECDWHNKEVSDWERQPPRALDKDGRAHPPVLHEQGLYRFDP